MKKSLLLAIAMVVASFSAANAAIIVTATNVEQPANDTLMFALPETPGCSQEIWTTFTHPQTGLSYRPTMYQPEYLVTALDFTCGDTEKGTATLPNNAKVIGLGLNGYLQACEDNDNCYQVVTAWCRNIPLSKRTLDFLDLFDGYSTHYPVGDFFTDTLNNHGPEGKPGIECRIDLNSNEDNLCSVVELDFGNAADPRTPFWYQGENIYLTLRLLNRYNPAWDGGTHIEYHYMAYDEADVQYASLMRSGNICFNSLTHDLVNYVPGFDGMDEVLYELTEHRLPAFRTPYYTNDVRIIRKGYNTNFVIKDQDGNLVEPAEDGNYYSLDHTMEYSVVVDDIVKGTFTFEDIYMDIDLEIENTTAVEELNANKTVSSVAYYNLAGQQSAQPVDGVNIVVTTYTDGSTTTAKVIK